MISMRKIAIQTLMVLAFLLASAACALAQAEINPDHFDDAPQQSVKRTSATPAAHAKANFHATQRTAQRAALQSGTTTHGSVHPARNDTARAATAHHSSSTKRFLQSDSDKRKKQLVSEAHGHGAP